MSKEKLTPVEWLLNELDERDMIDKTIYHEKDRTFDSISEQALKMEASQSKWISVEDEFPKEQGLYLCVVSAIGDEMVVLKYDGKGWWSSTCFFENTEVTHWQPLPPPPSEKK